MSGVLGRTAPRRAADVREPCHRGGRADRAGDGTNGLIYPPDGYLASLREVCDRHGILLIFDEVMSGFGRTGEWFACDHWNVAPDILCVAKGLNSGYVPLGAMVVAPIAASARGPLCSPAG